MMIVPGSGFVPKARIPGVDYDPHWANVVLLMHMDGENDGTVFTDETGKAVTVFGSTVTKTAVKQFGTASAYFDGTVFGALRTDEFTDLVFDGDFTVEYWVNTDPADVSAIARHVCQHLASSSNTSSEIRLTIGATAGVGIFTFANCSSGVVDTTGWIHVAATRSAGTDRLFLDGVLVDTATSTTQWTSVSGASQQISVGSFRSAFYSSGYTKGYIDELRITKGVARYTADFTPPTAPFPNS